MAGGTGVDPFLLNAATFLGAAVVAVPVARRLGMGSVLGYLAAGAAMGPHALGLFAEGEALLAFAEFGVVLLLFVIGLELNPQRLWRLRHEIFGLGLLQVGVTAAVLSTALLLVLDWPAAVATGAALALSSTAFAVQILREKGDLTKPYGDRAFSILLFQDLAIVPLLALVALLATGGEFESNPWISGLVAIAAVVAVLLIGRYGLGPLFRFVAASRTDEIFTAAALLVVVAAAVAMQMAGLSMAMGAFIAGVLLAESEFRHQLETDIEPFRGLLLGLFFMGVGLVVDWGLVIDSLGVVLGGAILLFAIKAVILFGLARAFGSGGEDALRISATLGQGGEFGFVLFAVAVQEGLLGTEQQTVLVAITTASMVLTPIAVTMVGRILGKPPPDMEGVAEPEEVQSAPIIIAGFGRFGQIVARILRLRGYELTLIDNNPDHIRVARTFGNEVYFGDIRRADVMRMAGADKARAVFLCADDPKAVEHGVVALRERYPEMLICARTYDRITEGVLRDAGADVVVREMLGGAIEMARSALERFGDGDVADDLVAEFRRRDAELARLQREHGPLKGYEKLRELFSLENER